MSPKLNLQPQLFSDTLTSFIKNSEENPDHDVILKQVGRKKSMWRSGQDGGSPLHDEILEAG